MFKNELPDEVQEYIASAPPLAGNAITVLEKRYLTKDADLNFTEDSDGLFWRTAKHLAAVELNYEFNGFDCAVKFFQLMRGRRWLPNSPTLANAGTRTGQLSACFVLPVLDDLGEIFSAIRYQALIHQTGGGTGFSFSRLRGKDSLVDSTKGKSTGPISFMDVFNAATESIKQGGVRRGANMGILRVDHPDIMEFIKHKEDLTKLTNFNISIAITDTFLKALKEGEDGGNDLFELIDPKYGPTGKYLNAVEIWHNIATRACATGEPGLWFIDRSNKYCPVPQLGKYEATNPCGEQPLIPYESCNLGSMTLDNYFLEDTLDAFNFEQFDRDVYDSIHVMDNVIDANAYVPSVPEIKEVTLQTRKLGLGVMGLARLLFKMGVAYDSPEGRDKAEYIYARMDVAAHEKSVALAKARGAYPYFQTHFDESVDFHSIKLTERANHARDKGFLDLERRYLTVINSMRVYGLRNSTLTTVAPTGTLSIIHDTTGGCEPVFALVFKRFQADVEMFEADPAFLKALSVLAPNKVTQILAALANPEIDGSLRMLLKSGVGKPDSITDKDLDYLHSLKKVFVTAGDIHPLDHVRMQACLQKYCDSAISKCLAAGTLIPTSKGLIKVENFSNNQVDDSFNILDGSLTTGGYKVVSHYRAGMKLATRIRLDNGATLIGAQQSHRVMTDSGWRLMSQLKPGDVVLGRFETSHGPGNALLSVPDTFRNNSNTLDIPTHMSSTFAEFLGMLAADGHTTETTGYVGITCKDADVEANFKHVVFKLFGKEPNVVIDKRNNVKSIYLTSRVLCRFVEELIGKGAYNKYVPDSILQGSAEEKLAFLRGITLDGYIHGEGSLVVYAGMSKDLAYHVSELCRSFGLPKVSVDTKSVFGASIKGALCYGVRVSNELQSLIIPIETHKQVEAAFVDYKVHIGNLPTETRKAFALSSTTSRNNPGYSGVRSMCREKVTHCFSRTAKKLGWPTETLAHMVTEVEDAGMLEMYDIEVEDVHEYVVNGMISHNTINLPESATVADVKEAYSLAIELNCKGITVYRNNCRAGQPLSTGTKSEIKVETVTQETTQPPENPNQGFFVEATLERGLRERPGRLYGYTERVTTGDGKLFSVLNFDEEGLREVVTTIGRSGGVLHSLTEAIGRLISVALKHRVPVKAIAEALRGIRSTMPYGFGPNQVLSIPDAIGKLMQEAPVTFPENQVNNEQELATTSQADTFILAYDLEAVEDSPDSHVQAELASVQKYGNSPECPECQSRLIFESGCKGGTCSNVACGWAKC